jgi:hypothetical protein
MNIHYKASVSVNLWLDNFKAAGAGELHSMATWCTEAENGTKCKTAFIYIMCVCVCGGGGGGGILKFVIVIFFVLQEAVSF